MSSFTAVSRRAAFTLPRATLTSARPFTTSFAAREKSATDSVKDGVKKADRTVSDNVIIPGLDAAASAKEKVVSGAKSAAGKTDANAEELKGEAKGTAEKMKGQAKGAAEEAKGKAKGAAEDVKQKL